MLDEADEQAIATEIDEAERGTHGQVRVVLDAEDGDTDERALATWKELDLDDVGVLVFVSVARREVRVLAGPRLLEATDDRFWQDAADAVAAGFRAADPPAGVRRALGPIGSLLRRVAPAT